MSDTAADVKEALYDRYNKPSQGRAGEMWVCIEEARSGAGFDGNRGQCDFLAINTWQSRGMELVGHEVKVSLSDWKAELGAPHKAEMFARFCRRWFVAAPSELAKKIKEEVPPAWGLLSVSPKGRVTEVRQAPARDPEPVPAWWWVGWLAQIDRQHKRRVPLLVDRAMRDERDEVAKRIAKAVDQRRTTADQQHARLLANVEALRTEAGIDLLYERRGNFKKFGAVWALAREVPNPAVLTDHLRRVADALESVASLPEREVKPT